MKIASKKHVLIISALLEVEAQDTDQVLHCRLNQLLKTEQGEGKGRAPNPSETAFRWR